MRQIVALRSALVVLALFTLLWTVLLFRDQGMDWDWGISILVAWCVTIVIAGAGTVFAAGRLRALMGIGPRVAKDTIGDVYLSPFPAYEDVELKAS